MTSMRVIRFAAVLTLCMGCNVPLRVGEVARVASPSGRLEAIVIEANTGPKASSSYDIFVVPSGEDHNRGVHVASLYAASRSSTAFGINLKWDGPEELAIEYLEARAAEIMNSTASVGGEQIQVRLRDGVEDPAAAPGGMLDNVKKRNQ